MPTWDDVSDLARRQLAELLLDSYRIRSGVRRAGRVDEAAYFEDT